MSVSVTNDRPDFFTTPRTSLGDMDGDVAGAVIAAASDIALVLDSDGFILDVAVAGDEPMPTSLIRGWIGSHWLDTVTVESRSKVEEMLSDATTERQSRARQVNHPRPGAADLPVRYSVVRVGQDGRLVALGRDLQATAMLQQRLVSAQQSMEREYSRLRHAETRYRVLFRLSSEPVLVVDASSLKIVDSNPAAATLMGDGAARMSGVDILSLFDDQSKAGLHSLFARVRSSGKVEEERVRLASTGGNGSAPTGHADGAFTISASMFRQQGAAHFLVRLGSLGDGTRQQEKDREKSAFLRVVEHLPDAFVIADEDLQVINSNSAFLDLVQVASQEQVKGVPLDRWLGRSGVDLTVLSANLREHGSVRAFGSVVRGEYGSSEPVEVTAVSVRNGVGNYIGLSIRSTLLRADGMVSLAEGDLPRSVEQLTELVGRVSLKELVREATDVIERLCIESALRLTRDNRASAAEMLGLSRQSLYSKMHRYGLGDLSQAED